MGITLRQIVFDICGGIKDGKKIKAVQIGGPSGGCLPTELLDTPVDYKSIGQTGAIMGSGGLVVMDEDTCMVDMARFFMDFTSKESCGKCVPCRIGTTRMLEILNRIVKGEGKEGDLDQLQSLGSASSFGPVRTRQLRSQSVLTTMKYFLTNTAHRGEVLSLIQMHFKHEYEISEDMHRLHTLQQKMLPPQLQARSKSLMLSIRKSASHAANAMPPADSVPYSRLAGRQ